MSISSLENEPGTDSKSENEGTNAASPAAGEPSPCDGEEKKQRGKCACETDRSGPSADNDNAEGESRTAAQRSPADSVDTADACGRGVEKGSGSDAQNFLNAREALPPIIARGIFGGILMGLANLVPGISGGTMLLASGVYQHFVDAIAELTRLKFRFRSIAVLLSVVAAAASSILLFAGPVKSLVVDHRWVMYSLFIGLTLGGIPVLWKLIRGGRRCHIWGGAAVGFTVMLLIAFLQMRGTGEASSGEIPWAMFLLGGALGASAMVLPGISGGYLLLLLGQYVPILGAVDAFKSCLLERDISGAFQPAISVLLPVGLGVIAGIVVVSNLLKFLFSRFETQTLGVLLGFLAGAVVGLWPFQEGVRPAPGFVFKGKALMTDGEIDAIRANWPTEFFTPSLMHIAGAIVLAAAGFGLTVLVDKIGSLGSSDGRSGGEASDQK